MRAPNHRLPTALRSWAPELEAFPNELATALGSCLPPLAAALGPLQRSRDQAGDDPDGLDGLTRRGDYQRLLPSEWAVADVVPDEFVRRAAMREHLFTKVHRQSPRHGRRVLVWIDSGPEQLGNPRVGQLAVLLALKRRARENDASLDFQILQSDDLALHPVDADGIRTWAESRTLVPASRDHLEAALAFSNTMEDLDEFWVLGSPQLRGVIETANYPLGIIPVAISDALEHYGHLHVRWSRRGTEHSLLLTMPNDTVAGRLVTAPLSADPNDESSKPTRSAGGTDTSPYELFTRRVGLDESTRLAVDPAGGLQFGRYARYVLARGVHESAIAFPTQPKSRGPARVLTIPPETRLVAAGLQQNTWLTVLAHKGELWFAASASGRNPLRGQRIAMGAAPDPIPDQLLPIWTRRHVDVIVVRTIHPDGSLYSILSSTVEVREVQQVGPEAPGHSWLARDGRVGTWVANRCGKRRSLSEPNDPSISRPKKSHATLIRGGVAVRRPTSSHATSATYDLHIEYGAVPVNTSDYPITGPGELLAYYGHQASYWIDWHQMSPRLIAHVEKREPYVVHDQVSAWTAALDIDAVAFTDSEGALGVIEGCTGRTRWVCGGGARLPVGGPGYAP